MYFCDDSKNVPPVETSVRIENIRGENRQPLLLLCEVYTRHRSEYSLLQCHPDSLWYIETFCMDVRSFVQIFTPTCNRKASWTRGWKYDGL